MPHARECRAALIAGDEKKAKECAKGWPYASYKMTIFSASEEKWVENDILHAKMYFNMPYALTVAGRRGKHWICRFRAQRNCRPRTDHQPESEVRSSNRHKASRSAGLIAKPGPCGWKRLTGCGHPHPSFFPGNYSPFRCHGRGRGFESRRPRSQKSCTDFVETIEDPKGHVFVPFLFVPLPRTSSCVLHFPHAERRPAADTPFASLANTSDNTAACAACLAGVIA